MTESPAPSAASATVPDARTQARIDQLRRRRAAGPAPSAESPGRRRNPATGTAIAALGFGGTAMFGIVAALAGSADGASTASTGAQVQPPIVVVLHSGASSAGGPGAAATVAVPPADPAVEPTPVELRAQPVVTTVEVQAPAPASSAPAARTNGSG